MSVVSSLLPVGIGVGAGLYIPKVFNLTGPARWLVPIGAGFVVGMVGKSLVGAKTAHLVGTGMIASSILMGLDDLLFKKQGTPLLAGESENSLFAGPDDEIPVISGPVDETQFSEEDDGMNDSENEMF